MRNEYLSFMCCPHCRSALRMQAEREHAGKVESGALECTNSACGRTYPIHNFVPLFVARDKYPQSFC